MASQVLSVKVSEDVIKVLGERAAEMGITRNRLATHALQAAVGEAAITAARRRRINAEVRARLEQERELVESGAIHFSHLPSVGSCTSHKMIGHDPDMLALSPAATSQLIMTDARIARLSRIIESTDTDAIRLQATEARSVAREQRQRIVLGDTPLEETGP